MRGALAALVALALAAPASIASARSDPSPQSSSQPVVVAIGGDSWLIPGRFPEGQSPDGNSVILKGSEGLILVDTGRRAGHVGSIMGAVFGLGDARPVAIVNTHWHLDHISGNPMLRHSWPRIKVYGTSAIDGALTGFLANSAAASRKALEAGTIPATAVADVKGDLATIERGQELRPDVLVDEPSDMAIAGRPLSLRVAHHAVTERDLWIYDAAEKRAIVGDLVTVPVPFLDTACPDGWLTALDEVAASGAEQIVPGHGPIMTITDFNRWRGAFGDFIACAKGASALETCSAGWAAGAAKWIGDDTVRAKAMADYYGELVRSKKLDGYCRA
ncbi:MAG TPA: MBL fold metallo-hydrolase [Sphingopyxis sp.]|nr:MBL fold metallo-hydrolase [Sphingopyxis sp.]